MCSSWEDCHAFASSALFPWLLGSSNGALRLKVDRGCFEVNVCFSGCPQVIHRMIQILAGKVGIQEKLKVEGQRENVTHLTLQEGSHFKLWVSEGGASCRIRAFEFVKRLQASRSVREHRVLAVLQKPTCQGYFVNIQNGQQDRDETSKCRNPCRCRHFWTLASHLKRVHSHRDWVGRSGSGIAIMKYRYFPDSYLRAVSNAPVNS